MRWVSVIATPLRLEDAVDEAAEGVFQQLGQEPDLVLVFVSSTYADHYSSLSESLKGHFPNAVTFGCSAGGVVGDKVELEAQNAVVLMAAVLPDVTIRSFHLGNDPDAWPEQMGIDPDESERSDFIVVTDPFSCDTAHLTSWLDNVYPESTKIGGIASGGWAPGESILLLNNDLHRTGAIGIALSGAIQIETIVAQGCRPIGTPLFITRANDNILHELDGQPAMQTLEGLFASLDDDDRKLAHTSLFLGLGMQDQKEVYEHGDFLIRSIIAVDPETRSISVAAKLKEGTIAQFHLRDAKTSKSDLVTLLDQANGPSPAGALLFSCMGRGKALYGEENHDTTLFHSVMKNVAMAGFFGNGEIGPVGGKTYLHSYTSAFALLSSK